MILDLDHLLPYHHPYPSFEPCVLVSKIAKYEVQDFTSFEEKDHSSTETCQAYHPSYLLYTSSSAMILILQVFLIGNGAWT